MPVPGNLAAKDECAAAISVEPDESMESMGDSAGAVVVRHYGLPALFLVSSNSSMLAVFLRRRTCKHLRRRFLGRRLSLAHFQTAATQFAAFG